MSSIKTTFKIELTQPTTQMTAIIAMKGPPFTQKTELATLIATSFGCPVLSLQHFLDSLKPPNDPSSLHPQDFSFEIICRIAQHHLKNKVSKHVVIDSPLSSSSHLHRIIEMASSIFPSPPKVIVVECKPKNLYLLQLKFHKHLDDNSNWSSKWYRPKNWEDMEKAIKEADYDDTSVINHELVSKLLVDPLADQPIDDLTPYSTKTHRIIQAVEHMIESEDNGGGSVTIYHQWKQSRYHKKQDQSSDESSEGDEKWSCSENGHNIYASTTEHDAKCMACKAELRVCDDAYNCRHCNLVLHKECGESYDDTITLGSPFPSSLLFPEYNFPDWFPCTSCKEEVYGSFNASCASCLFETHLECRLMPTVINHVDTEDHLLAIVLLPALKCEVHRCTVCGGSDKYNMYLCMICGVAYHFKCVTLPRRVEHEHGLHDHHLSLEFSSEEAEDYLCQECQELRDPGMWFYSCEECVYEVCLSCVHHISFVTPEV